MVELPEVGSIWDAKSEEDSVTVLSVGFGNVTYKWNGEDGGRQFNFSMSYANFLSDFTLRKEEKLEEVTEAMYRYENSPVSETRLFAIDSKEYEQVLVLTEHKEGGKSKSAHLLKLDVEDALDLAADLTRMAMQVKRRNAV